jgi:hypothetical protein
MSSGGFLKIIFAPGVSLQTGAFLLPRNRDGVINKLAEFRSPNPR